MKIKNTNNNTTKAVDLKLGVAFTVPEGIHGFSRDDVFVKVCDQTVEQFASESQLESIKKSNDMANQLTRFITVFSFYRHICVLIGAGVSCQTISNDKMTLLIE